MMKLNTYKKQLELNRSISSVWEEIRNLTGYSECKVSNIYKENGDTWYFTFNFVTKRFSRIISATISGKACSIDDSLTRIEIKSGSYFTTAVTIVECIVLIFITNFIREVIPNIAAKVLLMTSVVFGFIFAHNRESQLNVNEFIKKLHCKEDILRGENIHLE